MGVAEYEPRVVHQFLELWYRYVVDILTDAQVYSEHAGKPTIDPEDVKLTIQSMVLLELARSRNKVPLPKSIGGPGIRFPPEQDTLISSNYHLLIPKKPTGVEGPEEEEEASAHPDPVPSLASMVTAASAPKLSKGPNAGNSSGDLPMTQ